jgi:hypothetical protein
MAPSCAVDGEGRVSHLRQMLKEAWETFTVKAARTFQQRFLLRVSFLKRFLGMPHLCLPILPMFRRDWHICQAAHASYRKCPFQARPEPLEASCWASHTKSHAQHKRFQRLARGFLDHFPIFVPKPESM